MTEKVICDCCKQLVDSAPFGQCDECFENDMDKYGTVMQIVSVPIKED